MLDQEVKEKAKQIYTDSYGMSIGELANMYKDNELELQPEYQRFFRWSNSQKSSFIESILLGLPIPPIFIFQKEDGIWSVIDGLQRLSTIFQFMNILDVRLNGERIVEDLELHETKFLPSLKNKKWVTDSLEDPDLISNNLKLFFKRSKIDVKIIQYTSDVESQFELFQRLNTGGAGLTPQEIRNSLIIMENKQFYDWFEELNGNQDFQNSLPLSKKQINEKEDMEYLLRYLIYRKLNTNDIKGNEDINPFLTERMHELLKSGINFEEESIIFRSVFNFLNQVFGEDSFKRYDGEKSKFVRAFSLAHFEAIVPGLANYMISNSFELSEDKKILLESKIRDLSLNETFNNLKSQHRPIQRTKALIEFSKEYFNGL
ncbi:DUF262 domain-containing protein [Exiguobacterium acetylicum]|uniref:DUF262 domain-containing protein n=1 Tax=Exiguobacterium acetylicum TaxID=41170 RepID=UPI00387754B1